MRRARWGAGLAMWLGMLPGPAAAQDLLTLGQALERARTSAWANQIAAADARARAGDALAPYQGILPSVRLESGYIATTDPLSAFGFTLRQRNVTPAAFAPDRLNDPPTTHGIGTSVILEQPIFNADAWLGRKAAARARQAAEAGAAWVRSGTALEVVRRYWGAVLASEEVSTLTAAEQAAQSHHRQALALVSQGLATRSDALLTEVKAGEVRSQLLGAQSRDRLARHALAVLLGAPTDTAFLLPDALPQPTADAGLPAAGGERADVMAAEQAYQAAQANASRAGSSLLPRLNGFGRLDWNTPGTPFGGKRAWTVGLVLSWAPFSGGADIADRRRSRAGRDAAAAQAEAAAAQANLELLQASEDLTLAIQRLEIATVSVAQATEAHRIVSRKYDGGLATVTELFDASAAQTASELARSAARYDALIARTALDHASGRPIQ